MPFSDARLLNVLSHTFWFLPSVASCRAMRNLLANKQNRFYHDYKIVVAAGSAAGIGVSALPPVLDAMEEPLNSKTITLSCGKLTTGVTVKPWTGILMLRNSSSPETYFQVAFRVQSPWTVRNPDGDSPNKEQIIKEECYVFDFAPDRYFKPRSITDYARLIGELIFCLSRAHSANSHWHRICDGNSTMVRLDHGGISRGSLAIHVDTGRQVSVPSPTRSIDMGLHSLRRSCGCAAR
jgi:hypothetical protein